MIICSYISPSPKPLDEQSTNKTLTVVQNCPIPKLVNGSQNHQMSVSWHHTILTVINSHPMMIMIMTMKKLQS